MFQHIENTTVQLTRDYVHWFCDLPTFRGDRSYATKKGRSRILWLRKLLEEGKFYPPKWAITDFEGVTYRVNGGHSSQMLLQCEDGVFPPRMVANIDRFGCESPHDLADLFDQFDPKNSVRSTLDKVIMHKSVTTKLSETKPTSINRALSGVAAIMCEFGELGRLEEEERIRLIHANEEYLAWAVQYTGRREFAIAGVCAALFATYHKNNENAEVFWDGVRDGTGETTCPTRRLQMFLKTRMFPPEKDKWNTRAIYVKCIHAWNAFHRGTTTDLKYHPKSPLPQLLS